MTGYALFDTAVGRCGIAWGERGVLGVLGVQLPERDEERTRARLLKQHPQAEERPPPPDIRAVVDGIVSLLRGEAVDLSRTRLALERVPEFNRRVYEVALSVPPGKTVTYGEIAERLGDKALARDVGQALGQNPWPIVVPCHRVLAAGGRIGGFSANGGITTKHRLLTIEGAFADAPPSLFEDLPLATRPRRS